MASIQKIGGSRMIPFAMNNAMKGYIGEPELAAILQVEQPLLRELAVMRACRSALRLGTGFVFGRRTSSSGARPVQSGLPLDSGP